jgi:chemotaxis protein MotB
MKRIATLTGVSLLALSIVLSGCGKLSKKDFEAFAQQNAQAHSEFKNQIAGLDSEVSQQQTALMASIEQAKNEVTTDYEQGDADTIKAAKDVAQAEGAKLREELTKTANAASEQAQAIAKAEDQKLLEKVTRLEGKTETQGETVTKIQNALAETKEQILVVKKEAAAKPRLVATVRFSSGNTGLMEGAKQELDTAIKEIKAHPEMTVMVIGHADGTPVHRGNYRSNWDLSQVRADAVMNYLKAQGVTNSIQPIGRGDTEPIGPFYTKEGKAINRRTEVIISPPGPALYGRLERFTNQHLREQMRDEFNE